MTTIPSLSRTERRLGAVQVATELLCRQWKPRLLWLLISGCRRYNQLVARLPGISAKVLTQHLRALEREGLVTRHVAMQGRKRVEYQLTPLGAALEPVLRELEAWGALVARSRADTELPAGK
jgi:DNA-binding HxlR family transcriptional regulator